MTINRRGFIGGLLSALAAPAIITPGIVRPFIRRSILLLPPSIPPFDGKLALIVHPAWINLMKQAMKEIDDVTGLNEIALGLVRGTRIIESRPLPMLHIARPRAFG
jgi:hypothetical protein